MSRHIITAAWWFGVISLSLCLVNPAAAQVDQQRAEAYFKRAATICQRDGGRLWGVSLCGPMVFADARTRTYATNQPRALMPSVRRRKAAFGLEGRVTPMGNRLFLALIISLLIGTTNHARAGQNQNKNEREARRNDSSDQITPEEIRQARALADRFMKRLRETRDLTPLVSEMFTSNFKRMIEEDASWSGIVGQGRSLVEHISQEQRLRCFIVNFNLQYLIRLYIASKVTLDSERVSPEGDILPPRLTEFFKDNSPPGGAVETTEQARVWMSFLERAVALMQEEVAKNPPEQTAQFRTNLASFEEHLKEHVEERPSVRMYDQARNGLAAGTRLIRMVIPFHVGLAMIKEKDSLKLDLVATQLPPP